MFGGRLFAMEKIKDMIFFSSSDTELDSEHQNYTFEISHGAVNKYCLILPFPEYIPLSEIRIPPCLFRLLLVCERMAIDLVACFTRSHST